MCMVSVTSMAHREGEGQLATITESEADAHAATVDLPVVVLQRVLSPGSAGACLEGP